MTTVSEPAITRSFDQVTLDDKYCLESGRIFLTGIQALVRLPLMQRQRDLARGLNTAGFISGYRGSPLAGYDQALWKARKFLKENHVHFEPGINEDLAATAVWGSQQTSLFPGARYGGTFSIWYGKGPGVDRTMDVFRHANAAGAARHGGVLVVAGDDHGAVSSTVAHQTDHNFMTVMMPVLHPANVQEYLDFGLLGWEMSRFSGCWIGFKAVSETVESSASVFVDPDRLNIVTPNFEMPEDGLHIRVPDNRFEQEYRLQKYKVYAAREFARANGIDRTVIESPKPRFGIVTTGKSYLDVRQALHDLGIDDELAAEIGLSVYKVGMPWPLDPVGVRRFAQGLDELLVVEEKRALIENQLKEQLYNWHADVRPQVVGKFDEKGEWLLPAHGELTPARVARVIAARIDRFHTSERIRQRLAFLDAKEKQLDREPPATVRTPYFCSGCPHNTSTRLPEGSRAIAGIGCHFMVSWMNRNSETFTQMGGEGIPWLGQAPFTDEKHIFANLGDGTYFHSGSLAVRAAVASGANITYKILYNDAIAMTGGQPVEGQLTPWHITRQMHAEGVKKIVVVTDEPDKYPVSTDWAPGVTIRHRDELDAVQRTLREVEGTTILLYDQTCAAEKRRRRKRGTYPDPARRAFINDLVCEGCGDCSVQSNCLSVEPLETGFGRKRQINQSSCNKDFSCLKGFCPSFVTVEGGSLRRPAATEAADILAGLPLPQPARLDAPYRILVTGVGGTGVITIGALLGMAAHLEGKGVSILDQTGLAQKGGAVLSHVQLAAAPDQIDAVRIAAGEADLVLGSDMVVSGSFEALAKIAGDKTRVVVNTHQTPTMDTTQDPDALFHGDILLKSILEAAGEDACDAIEATALATSLMGDAIATNLFLVGYAFQKGLIPLGLEAIHRAIELNAVAVDFNKRAFAWGRKAALDLDAVQKLSRPAQVAEAAPAETLDDVIARRVSYLTDYQNAAYARRYEALVRQVEAAEKDKAPARSGLALAVARYAFKLMAYKDEYEVARLYTSGAFEKKLRAQFEGGYKLKFHMAPPLLARRDEATGQLKKAEFGPWALPALRLLARFKGLRGTALDIFGRTQERKTERRLITDYEKTVAELLTGLNDGNHKLAVQIAEVPEHIRGFGHVKERHLKQAKANEALLLDAFRNPSPAASAAE